MKRLILTGTLALSIAGCSSAQKTEKEGKGSKIPATVQEAFKKQFPTITDVDWEQEGSNYEAEFENGEIETSVVINTSGVILETETEMETSALPKAVLDYIELNYKGQKVKEAAKIVLNDGTVNYEAEVNKKDVIFDSNGTFIKVITE
ncbi:MAG: PepSY-like domain-containing protein [Fluviicola sp.]|uniref:PepSY-like domain-containing protein n=1 Tax=uncultured Fluviicola sp. TaxID=463303 RepID=UPI0025DD6F41|nr:PepSY-like domain-containing protein [uncultured Fluviicola sp.]